MQAIPFTTASASTLRNPSRSIATRTAMSVRGITVSPRVMRGCLGRQPRCRAGGRCPDGYARWVASSGQHRKLEVRFHGRIIDHLAVQTYQSPVAAIAEMVANAWDADAGDVRVTLP